jgi:hypothetical protein
LVPLRICIYLILYSSSNVETEDAGFVCWRWIFRSVISDRGVFPKSDANGYNLSRVSTCTL